MRTTLLSLLMLILAAEASAGPARLYEAPVDRSQWLYKQDKRACHLAHPIPELGTALFTVNHQLDMTLRLLVDWPAADKGVAEVHVLQPAWRRGEEKFLHKTRYEPEHEAFRFSHYTSRRMYTALEQGRMPALRFGNWFGDGRVQVALSPVHFRTATASFEQCIQRLATASPEGISGHANLVRAMDMQPAGSGGGSLRQASASGTLGAAEHGEPRAVSPTAAAADADAETDTPMRVFFATDSAGLTQPAMRRLDTFAATLRDRSDWDQVVITGHADERGNYRYNDRLSDRRARQVKAYLVEQGVDAGRIQLHSVGERQPLAAGPHPTALAKNRRARVELRVLNGWERASSPRARAALRLLVGE